MAFYRPNFHHPQPAPENIRGGCFVCRAATMQYDRGKTAARGYGGRWQRERLAYLQQHPLCIMCQAQGRVTRATVVDHIKPHKGNPVLMWDKENNWQSLCANHHNSDKQRLEKSGKTRSTIGTDGWPI